jgi:hypothetical protein
MERTKTPIITRDPVELNNEGISTTKRFILLKCHTTISSQTFSKKLENQENCSEPILHFIASLLLIKHVSVMIL